MKKRIVAIIAMILATIFITAEAAFALSGTYMTHKY